MQSTKKQTVTYNQALGNIRSVSERTIQMQFLFEGLTLTFICGMIGHVIGLLLAKIISIIMSVDFIPDLFTGGIFWYQGYEENILFRWKDI